MTVPPTANCSEKDQLQGKTCPAKQRSPTQDNAGEFLLTGERSVGRGAVKNSGRGAGEAVGGDAPRAGRDPSNNWGRREGRGCNPPQEVE